MNTMNNTNTNTFNNYNSQKETNKIIELKNCFYYGQSLFKRVCRTSKSSTFLKKEYNFDYSYKSSLKEIVKPIKK